MSWQAIQWAMKAAPTVGANGKRLTHADRTVLIIMADAVNETRNNGIMWKSSGTIAKIADMEPGNVRKSWGRLEDGGWITKVGHQPPVNGQKPVARWRLNMSPQHVSRDPHDRSNPDTSQEYPTQSESDRTEQRGGVNETQGWGQRDTGGGVNETHKSVTQSLSESGKYSSPAGAGGDGFLETDRSTEEPTDYSHFVEMVTSNPLLNQRLQEHSMKYGFDPREAYENFYNDCGDDMSTSWIKKFRGYTQTMSDTFVA